jgi:phosphoglycerol transferase
MVCIFFGGHQETNQEQRGIVDRDIIWRRSESFGDRSGNSPAQRKWTREHALTLGFFVAGLVATYYLLGFSSLKFTEPASLSGDHVFYLTMFKETLNGVGVFNENLGAPSHNFKYLFPLFDGSYKALIWIVTRFTSNIFLAVSLFFLAGVALIFASSFWSLRILNVHPLLASVASIAFIMSPFFAVRLYGHDLLILYYSVPMGATLALLMADGDAVKKARTTFAICAVLLVGTSGFYYAFFTAMFLGLTMTAASFNQRSIKPLVLCAAIAVVMLLLLLFSAYGYHMVRLLDGGIPAPPTRYRWEQFFHGLIIGNAMHVYGDLGLFASRIDEFRKSIPAPLGEGYTMEWPGVVLTTVILASPAALFPFLRAQSQQTRLIALCLACITFGLLFASRAGLGSIFTFLITPGLRAQERILPFLTFFAIAALCLGSTAINRCSHRWIVSFLVGCALLSGIYPAFNVFVNKQTNFLADKAELDNWQSVRAVLKAKDSAGLAAIFQLPVMAWPEAAPINKLESGQHLLPYLLDKNGSKTRWSHGLSTMDIAPFVAVAAAEADMPSNLKRIGFDGILVEKRGYETDSSAALMASLTENGACIKYEDQLRALLAICR